jgi:hypothetical protein
MTILYTKRVLKVKYFYNKCGLLQNQIAPQFKKVSQIIRIIRGVYIGGY